MLDSDLAELYGIETKALKRAVKRNKNRFPGEFMLELTKEEEKNLRCQFGTSSYGGRRYLPYAFTEHGMTMLSSVLNSHRAVQMNILIIRAFINLRRLISEHKDLSKRLDQVERKQKFNEEILAIIVKDVNKLKNPPKTNLIGFRIK